MKKRIVSIRQSIIIAFIAGLGITTTSCSDEAIPLINPGDSVGPEFDYTWAATADSLQNATYNSYLGSNGTFVQDNAGNSTFHYWPNAHVLDMLVDAYLRTGDENYALKMKALVQGIKVKNGNTYNNVFNDDMIWLGNSCMRAFEATNDQEYKDVAELLWEIIKTSWTDEVFGGGITWKQDTPFQKNAVSNAPAAILAMRLYEVDQDEQDLEWAMKIYAWQKSKLVDPITGIVWDNISQQNGVTVTNTDWVFTYNMGTWIGAGLRLYEATNNPVYLTDAVRSAKTSMTSPKLVLNGLLRDEGQGDGGLFKGIFIRYFTEIIEHPAINSSDRQSFVNFFKYNAQTLYKSGIRRPVMFVGPNWSTNPAGNTDLTTQVSGVMLIEAAAKLDEQDLLQ